MQRRPRWVGLRQQVTILRAEHCLQCRRIRHPRHQIDLLGRSERQVPTCVAGCKYGFDGDVAAVLKLFSASAAITFPGPDQSTSRYIAKSRLFRM
jgi:hypothetical protein